MEPHDPSAPRSWADRPIWQIRPLRDAFVLVVLFMVATLAYRTRYILVPVGVGLLLAYVCHPLISLAERRLRLPRPVSAALLLAVGYALFIGVGAWFVPLLVVQLQTLVELVPYYLQQLSLGDDLELEGLIARTQQWLVASQERPLQIFQAVVGVVGVTTRALLWIFLPPVCFFFFAWWLPRMYARAMQYVPDSRRERVEAILDRMNTAVGGFLRARLIVAVVIGVAFSGAFYLAGVPFWFLLGMGTGFASIIPYVSGLGWILAMALKYFEAAATGEPVSWISVLLWPTIAYWAVNVVEEWVLLPWIQSREMNLSALTVLVVVLIGGVLAGLLGLLLAVPVAACIKILVSELLTPRLRAWARRH